MLPFSRLFVYFSTVTQLSLFVVFYSHFFEFVFSFISVKQRFLTVFGLFSNIDFYYDRIYHPTILVNVNIRHFIDSQHVLKDYNNTQTNCNLLLY